MVYDMFGSNIVDHTFSDGTGVITFSGSVRSIGDSSFLGEAGVGFEYMTSITIPDSVKSFGNSAFKGCTSLASIDNTNVSASMDWNVFEGCTSLRSINFNIEMFDISSGLRFRVGSSIFSSCTSLEEATITITDPNNTPYSEYINYMFDGCTSLRRATISSRSSLEFRGIFRNCSNLRELTLNSYDKVWTCLDDDHFKSIPSTIETIYVPSSLLDLYIESWPDHASKFRSIVE